MMIKMGKKGFTLVEIMIVVAIIGLLAAIAIPNFVHARARAQAQACVANLKQIEGAMQIWAVDNSKSDTSTVKMTDLVTTYIKTTPTCQGGGTYTVVAGIPVSNRPECTIGVNSTDASLSHNLP